MGIGQFLYLLSLPYVPWHQLTRPVTKIVLKSVKRCGFPCCCRALLLRGGLLEEAAPVRITFYPPSRVTTSAPKPAFSALYLVLAKGFCFLILIKGLVSVHLSALGSVSMHAWCKSAQMKCPFKQQKEKAF